MIVADTHVLIWDALAPARLSPSARQAIAQANQEEGLLVCDISLWEIAMLLQKGRVQVDLDCQSFITLLLQANKTTIQPITARIATLAVQLGSEISKDPADRLIAATALAEGLPLLTADLNLQAASSLQTVW